MREIKFRAWDSYENKMLERTDRLRLDFKTGEVLEDVGQYEEDYLPWDGVLMQYTGLKDKNDKEIYEGDIVSYKFLSGFDCDHEDFRSSEDVSEFIGAVELVAGEYLPREYYREVDDGFYSYRYFDLEVIGNIYENQELLKET